MGDAGVPPLALLRLPPHCAGGAAAAAPPPAPAVSTVSTETEAFGRRVVTVTEEQAHFRKTLPQRVAAADAPSEPAANGAPPRFGAPDDPVPLRIRAQKAELEAMLDDVLLLEERHRVLAPSACIEPSVGSFPRGEATPCQDFRAEIDLWVGDLPDHRDVNSVLRELLQRLDAHAPGEKNAEDMHTRMWGAADEHYNRFHYAGRGPQYFERIHLRIGLVWMAANAAVSLGVAVWYFKHGLWEFGTLALCYILLSDLAQVLAWEELKYKHNKQPDERPYPKVWPVRLHCLPLVGAFAQAAMLLNRSHELGLWRKSQGRPGASKDVTHAQILYHSQVYGLFLRVLYHTLPLFVQCLLVRARSEQLHLAPIPSDDWYVTQVTLSAGFVCWVTMLVSWNICCGAFPDPKTRPNLWGLPPFPRGWCTSFLSLLYCGGMAGAMVPVVRPAAHFHYRS